MWVVASIFMTLMTMFYASVIVPLFNKLTPLENGELRSAIEQYAGTVKFHLNNIFVMDGSKRSSKANAFFTGLGSKKKIVLYDTLIKNHTVPELVAVLAHEVGHYKKKHTRLSVILSVIQTGAVLFILSVFVNNPALSQALNTEPGFHIGLLVFGMLFSPVSTALSILMNLISRKNEFEADAYAAETYGGTPLEEALKKLSVHHLSNLKPHPAYVFFHYSHPPLLERIRQIRQHPHNEKN
jgi:STE24 endopeptidase